MIILSLGRWCGSILASYIWYYTIFQKLVFISTGSKLQLAKVLVSPNALLNVENVIISYETVCINLVDNFQL